MSKPQQSLERQHERLEQETREGLSDNSSVSTRKASGGESWGNDHPVNIRLSMPLLFGRYYVTLVAGKERRSGERLASERPRWAREITSIRQAPMNSGLSRTLWRVSASVSS